MSLPSSIKRCSVWLFFVAVLTATLISSFGRAGNIQTNILALLPATEQDVVVQDALDAFYYRVARQVFFLVQASDRDKARSAAEHLHQTMVVEDMFSEISFRASIDDQRSVYELYFPHRFTVLSDESRRLLLQQKGESITQQALNSLYSPVGSSQVALLSQDPFFLFPDFLSRLPRPQGTMVFDDGLLTQQNESGYYVLLSGQLRASPFLIQTQIQLGKLTEHISKTVLTPYGAQLTKAGVVFHAEAGTLSAQKEISTIGLGSLIGIVILVLWVFRTIYPLLLCFLSIATGVATGYISCLYIFGEVHLLTMVFSASLIGVSIDYAFHYFTERCYARQGEKATFIMDRVLPGILAGLITSVIAYLGLSIAPFPGLRQMAVFSATGLIAAFITVWLLFPCITFRQPKQLLSLLFYRHYLDWWQRLALKKWWSVPLAIFILPGCWMLNADDDIRQLQSLSPQVVAEEQHLKGVVAQQGSSQFFLIEGETPAQVLMQEETLVPQLQSLQERGDISSFQRISVYVPSPQQQQHNYDLVTRELYQPYLEKYFNNIGLVDKEAENFRQLIVDKETDFLTVGEWLASAASRPWRHLWLGKTERGYGSIISLTGVQANGLARVAALETQYAGVSFVNRVADISTLFKRYREQALILLVLSYLLIFLLWRFRYGSARALMVMLPPVLGVFVTMSVLGYLGEPFTLFNALALILVLGIGIDYTLFFQESKGRPEVTLLAITLSALTTLLSFGLLSLSQTAAIHAFGITVFVGIVTVFFLAPVVTRRSPHCIENSKLRKCA